MLDVLISIGLCLAAGLFFGLVALLYFGFWWLFFRFAGGEQDPGCGTVSHTDREPDPMLRRTP